MNVNTYVLITFITQVQNAGAHYIDAFVGFEPATSGFIVRTPENKPLEKKIYVKIFICDIFTGG